MDGAELRIEVEGLIAGHERSAGLRELGKIEFSVVLPRVET